MRIKTEAAQMARDAGNKVLAKFFERAAKDEGRHARLSQGSWIVCPSRFGFICNNLLALCEEVILVNSICRLRIYSAQSLKSRFYHGTTKKSRTFRAAIKEIYFQ